MVYGTLMIAFVVLPFTGLAIDVGLMYLAQSRLLAAADAAAIAGASALSRGSDDSSQRANAVTTANAYFYANFPSGYLESTNLQVNSVAATDDTHLRSITTTASVDMPLIFLGMFNTGARTITVTSKSTRRDINIMVVMDRSGSLATSYNGQPAACNPLKAAAVNFVNQFAETRDNLGLITFATSSNVDYAPATTFKTSVEGYLNAVNCTGATSSAQALWQGYDQLVKLNQNGALNAILFFTDGRPTAVTENFPMKGTCASYGANPREGVLTLGYNNNVPSTAMGLYKWAAPGPPPLASDLSVITDQSHCSFATNQSNVSSDVSNAPVTDVWGNSLTATAYRSVTYSGSGLSVTNAQNVENFATNAADHAALRIRRGDPDPAQANNSLSGVVIYCIGYGGDVDSVLLQRIANDPSLTTNPVAAGSNGRYYNAPTPSDLNQAFIQVASQMLRIAQ
ncbi:MAG TPA: vWA domain-containing protein [Bryobacteraceae bacterium]|nr:vWA domain-containing protein [Bryobacteraceae bacterium]